jgi:hypothetical protein
MDEESKSRVGEETTKKKSEEEEKVRESSVGQEPGKMEEEDTKFGDGIGKQAHAGHGGSVKCRWEGIILLALGLDPDGWIDVLGSGRIRKRTIEAGDESKERPRNGAEVKIHKQGQSVSQRKRIK